MKLSRSGLPALAAACLSATSAAAQQLASYSDTIPGTLVVFSMAAVPAGTVTLDSGGTSVTVHTPSFWIGATEVTWDMYDIFAFRLDVPREQRGAVDATARPSRPYGAPDRGFGHAGYPVISVTHAAAVAFARWLSVRTGRRYEVATEAQWRRAAALGGSDRADPAIVRRRAWSADDSGDRTHPVGSREPDQLGIHDLLGNAGEWVTGIDGVPVVVGGSYLDPATRLSSANRATHDPAWHQTDPQIPKSRWWLSDATFTGFRLVRLP